MQDLLIERHTRQTARCRSCDASIEWAVIAASKRRMPFDYPIVLSAHIDIAIPEDVVIVDMTRTTSHFATCPHADRWRKNKQPKK